VLLKYWFNAFNNILAKPLLFIHSFIHLFIHSGMHEKALNWACIPYISLVLNAKKIKILIVRCHDKHDEIKVIIIIKVKT